MSKTKTQNTKSMNRIALQKRLEFHERLGRPLSEEDALNVDFFMNDRGRLRKNICIGFLTI